MNFYRNEIVFLAFENLVIALTNFALVIYLMHLHLNCWFSAFSELNIRIVMAIHFDKALVENINLNWLAFFLILPFFVWVIGLCIYRLE